MQSLPFTLDELTHSITMRFEWVAARLPDSSAISQGGKSLRYKDLNSAANRLAHVLLQNGAKSGQPIALLLPHGIELVTAILATLKVGGIYAALDPDFPDERLTVVLDDLDAKIIVTNSTQIENAQHLAGEARIVVNLDGCAPDVPDDNPEVEIASDQLAGLFYTSGSTGVPKGIGRTHALILQEALTARNYRQTNPEDRQSSLFYPGFGASVTDIFSGLLNGATIFPFSFKQQSLGQLAKWLYEEAISIIHVPVAVWRLLLTTQPSDITFPQLRIVHLGGNRVFKSDIEATWPRIAENGRVEHRFSATETGNITRIYLDRATPVTGEVIPAGYPIDGKEVLIIDESGTPLPQGATGQIAVKSKLIASGYWGRPELTAQKFEQSADGTITYYTGDHGHLQADGCLIHQGRGDSLVKIRGYRVETAEVEAHLCALEGVQQAVVVVDELGGGSQRLLAYVRISAEYNVTIQTLRQQLRSQLPDYMLPAQIVRVAEFELTPNGKINHRRLPAPDNTRPELNNPFEPARTPIEESVAQIVSELLKVQPVGIHDSFFELGGDSLQAARLLSRIDDVFGIEITLADFYTSPTVASANLLITQPDNTSNEEVDLATALRMLGEF